MDPSRLEAKLTGTFSDSQSGKVQTKLSVKQLTLLSRVWLFVALWTVARQAPLSWDSPGKNTGVGSHSLHREIFPTQG